MTAGRHRRPDPNATPKRVTRRAVVLAGMAAAFVVGTTGVVVAATMSPAASTPGTVYLNGSYACVPVTSPTPSPSTTVTPTPTPSSTSPTPTPTVTSSSGAPVGDLPGWHQVFVDDFATDAAQGQFLARYPKWSAYPTSYHDTSGAGQYNPQYLSVASGLLDIHLSTVNGVPQVNAPEPMNEAHQTYGRYSVRFRATANGYGYKTAWLLWSDAKQWPAGGEIDFPEGDLAGDMNAFAHYADPGGGQDAFTGIPNSNYSGWHTATTEWSPGRVTFYLDGKVVGTSTHEVPSGPMRFVLQTETDGGKPATNVTADVQIDWVSIYSYAP